MIKVIYFVNNAISTYLHRTTYVDYIDLIFNCITLNEPAGQVF